MSKEHRPNHINRWSGQRLENKEQVCPSCHLNFGTTEAGDSHRFGEPGVNRTCLTPANVGLVIAINRFGTEVWRLPNVD